MKVNLSDIRLSRTAAKWPKVRFTVVLGEGDPFEPRFESEGWTLYRSGVDGLGMGKQDDRGVAQVRLVMPQTPLLYKIPGAGPRTYKLCGWTSYQACDEKLFEGIKAHLLGIKRVRGWMNLSKLDEVEQEKQELEDGTVTRV